MKYSDYQQEPTDSPYVIRVSYQGQTLGYVREFQPGRWWGPGSRWRGYDDRSLAVRQLVRQSEADQHPERNDLPKLY